MAVGSPAPGAHSSHTPSTPSANQTGIDIDAWTISALQSLSVSPVARGTGTPLAIPIDEHVLPVTAPVVTASTNTEARTVKFHADEPVTAPRRPPSRRDSMAKREALLKGKEGSRQRRRWENGKPDHTRML